MFCQRLAITSQPLVKMQIEEGEKKAESVVVLECHCCDISGIHGPYGVRVPAVLGKRGLTFSAGLIFESALREAGSIYTSVMAWKVMNISLHKTD